MSPGRWRGWLGALSSLAPGLENDAARKLIARELDALLRPAGFRRRGLVFRRERDEQVHVVSLQSSQSSTKGRLKVTLNLGIHSFALNARLVEMGLVRGRVKGKVDIAACHWRIRLGHLRLKDPHDQWWTVTSERTALKAAREMKDLLERRGLPRLEGLSSTAALRKLWEAGTGDASEETQDLYARALRTSE
ncbi:MAG: DUF4304 domain-containing protein [Myxococcales bacterium]